MNEDGNTEEKTVRRRSRRLLILAGVCGVLGVGLGAIGGHGLEDRIEEAGRAEEWRTATRYLLIHAVACLAVGLGQGVAVRVRALAGFLFGVGGIIFGGSLYALCLTGITLFGAITPLGGLCLVAGWVVVAFPQRRQSTL